VVELPPFLLGRPSGAPFPREKQFALEGRVFRPISRLLQTAARALPFSHACAFRQQTGSMFGDPSSLLKSRTAFLGFPADMGGRRKFFCWRPRASGPKVDRVGRPRIGDSLPRRSQIQADAPAAFPGRLNQRPGGTLEKSCSLGRRRPAEHRILEFVKNQFFEKKILSPDKRPGGPRN
jgi:hypothetical protein